MLAYSILPWRWIGKHGMQAIRMMFRYNQGKILRMVQAIKNPQTRHWGFFIDRDFRDTYIDFREFNIYLWWQSIPYKEKSNTKNLLYSDYDYNHNYIITYSPFFFIWISTKTHAIWIRLYTFLILDFKSLDIRSFRNKF